MNPARKIDENSRQQGHVARPMPFSSRSTAAARPSQSLATETSTESATAGPPLALEPESSRRSRSAKVLEKQSQGMDPIGDGVWSSVWTTHRDLRAHTPPSQTEPRDSSAPNLALAPDASHEPDHTMYEAQLRAADGAPCSDLARRALQAAKSADTVGDWQAAIRHFTVAIKNGANDPQVYFRLGVLLRKTHGDLRLSLAHLRKASLLQPDQVVYRRELAELYDVLGFPINARSQRERIQEIQGVVPTKRTWWFW